jgi:restriction endonuclease Mrr
MHVRQICETVVKRKLVDERTQPNDLVRLTRAALLREQRESEAEGLRPRLRALGGGNYGTVDRKLDPELLSAERDLGERAARLRDATRTAVRRRLARMSPAAFDALGRTLCDKLGITGLELLRRGEGVTYWGGTSMRGVGAVRTLVALRPGEAEITRRGVGELRAGLAAKGYDEGLLLSAGRPNAEALAELKVGGVRLYDGQALAGLLMKHGLGVRRVAMPVDYLDLDFFGELQDS